MKKKKLKNHIIDYNSAICHHKMLPKVANERYGAEVEEGRVYCVPFGGISKLGTINTHDS